MGVLRYSLGIVCHFQTGWMPGVWVDEAPDRLGIGQEALGQEGLLSLVRAQGAPYGLPIVVEGVHPAFAGW